jgi:hypothetical protein
MTIDQDARERVRSTVPKLSPAYEAGDLGFIRIPVENDDLPVPAIAHGLLVDVLGCRSGRGGDKTAWAVEFSWDGRPCVLAYEKFGLRLYIAALGDDDKKCPEKAARLIIKGLRRAIGAFEKEVLTPLVTQQLEAGQASIANQAPQLRGMYDHFRKRVEQAFSSEPPETTADGLLPGLGESLSWKFRRDQEASFDALAMVNAYFSLLEHTLVLVLPFSDFDPGAGQLHEFIGLRWREKLQRVYDINANRPAKRVHDELHRVSEAYRNTYSHGGFDKAGSAIYVHFPAMGGAPGTLSGFGDSPHNGLFAVTQQRFEAICQCFDHADELLRSGETRMAMMWVDAGLDVSFDARSRERYAEHMVDYAEFEGFIENTWRYAEAVMNFEV